MIRRSWERTAVIAVVLSVALALQGCNDNQLKQVATNIDRAAVLIGQTREVRDDLFAHGLISKDEAHKITVVLVRINRNVKTFNDKARTYQSVTPQAKADAKKFAADFADGINELIQNGTLGVKNPQSKEKLGILTDSLKELSLTLIQSIDSLKVEVK